VLFRSHAEPLDRLFVQQIGLRIEPCRLPDARGLLVSIPLAGGRALRLLIAADRTRYLLERGGELEEINPDETNVERGVYLLLADLARQP